MRRPWLGWFVAIVALVSCSGVAARETYLDAPHDAPDSRHWSRRDCPWLAYYARTGASPGRSAWLETLERVGCVCAVELPERGADESEASHLERVALMAGTSGWLPLDAWTLLDEAGDEGLLAMLRVSQRQGKQGEPLGSLPESFPGLLLRGEGVARAVLDSLASTDVAEREAGIRLAGHVRRASPAAPAIVRALRPMLSLPPNAWVDRRCGNADFQTERVTRLLHVQSMPSLPRPGPALGAFSRLAEDDDLVDLLRHEDDVVARSGVLMLSWRPSMRALSALAAAAGDERLAPTALIALSSWGATRDVRATLRGHFGSASGPLRLQLAAALAQAGDPEGLDALAVAACGDDEVAKEAATLLERLVGPKAEALDWRAWWSSRRDSFDLGLHHAQRLLELARVDMSDEPSSLPHPNAIVIAEACTQACIPVLERASAAASEQGRPIVQALLAANGDRWREGGLSPVVAHAESVRATLRDGTLDEVAAALDDRAPMPPSLVRAALHRVADDGWEAESLLLKQPDAVGCEELDSFLDALDAEDVEDLGSDFWELRQHLRCD